MGRRLMLVVERQLVSKAPSENAHGQPKEREAPEKTELPNFALAMQSRHT